MAPETRLGLALAKAVAPHKEVRVKLQGQVKVVALRVPKEGSLPAKGLAQVQAPPAPQVDQLQ